MLCDRELKTLFRRFNREYWNGELPDDTDVYFAPTDPSNVAYCTVQNDGTNVIRISPSISGFGRYFKLVLIHEMCHLALGHRERKLHGPTFKKELLRVLRAGAIKYV